LLQEQHKRQQQVLEKSQAMTRTLHLLVAKILLQMCREQLGRLLLVQVVMMV
jgi:hypothetical protein